MWGWNICLFCVELCCFRVQCIWVEKDTVMRKCIWVEKDTVMRKCIWVEKDTVMQKSTQEHNYYSVAETTALVLDT